MFPDGAATTVLHTAVFVRESGCAGEHFADLEATSPEDAFTARHVARPAKGERTGVQTKLLQRGSHWFDGAVLYHENVRHDPAA
jgi:hypothetical protein